MSSTDLTLRKGRCDADYLIALGWSARNSNPHAATLVRLHLALDKAALVATIKTAQLMTKRLSIRRAWRLGPARIKHVGELAARYYVVPVCGVCFGVRWQRDTRTGGFLPAACPHCDGSGKEPTPRGTDGLYVAEVVAALERIEREATKAVREVFYQQQKE